MSIYTTQKQEPGMTYSWKTKVTTYFMNYNKASDKSASCKATRIFQRNKSSLVTDNSRQQQQWLTGWVTITGHRYQERRGSRKLHRRWITSKLKIFSDIYSQNWNFF